MTVVISILHCEEASKADTVLVIHQENHTMWLQVSHRPEMRCYIPLSSGPPKIETQNIKIFMKYFNENKWTKTCETQKQKILFLTWQYSQPCLSFFVQQATWCRTSLSCSRSHSLHEWSKLQSPQSSNDYKHMYQRMAKLLHLFTSYSNPMYSTHHWLTLKWKY